MTENLNTSKINCKLYIFLKMFQGKPDNTLSVLNETFLELQELTTTGFMADGKLIKVNLW